MDFGFLNEAYQSAYWRAMLHYLFGETFQEVLLPMDMLDEHDRIESFTQCGSIALRDMARTRINVYEVTLKPGLTKVHRNRVMLATIIEKIRSDASVSAALAAFADPESGKWRMTLVAKRESYGADGALNIYATEPKRYTYLLGQGENTRTARQRLEALASISNKRLEDVLAAFSVESINREFFDRYKKLYENCWHYLAKPDSKVYEIFKIDPQVATDAAKKPIRDFAKRLLGRLVFIHFLQKKGWMGCPINSEKISNGDPDFVANIFRQLSDEGKSTFYSKELTRLFFNTLNEPREGNLFIMPDGRAVQVPFLNGGLFEKDVAGSEYLDLPASWFADLFAFFGQYNFTVDESAPNDHEIGIDPEMLGHIFENLLEENREKGAYYTPKDIVHYICQESLLLYLKERLGLATPPTTYHAQESWRQPPDIKWSDSRAKDEQELAHFVRHKQRGSKDGFIYANARLLEKLLKEVRVCDPAIGSGAFPMGLLYEIFYCQVELDLTEDYAALKKEIIDRCIYGVDKDKGAVDIARLRFWLALIVDELEPHPLPNLDYKIMQGDSLLESFEGIDLSNLLGGDSGGAEQKKTTNSSSAPELWAAEEPTIAFGEQDKAQLENWIKDYFDTENSKEKTALQTQISTRIDSQLQKAISQYQDSLQELLDGQKTNLARDLDIKRPGTKYIKEIQRLEKEIADCNAKQQRLAWWQARDEKPYFLWHTWFKEVFDTGGFDIVIGNPPYVRQEAIGPDLKAVLKELYPLTFKGTADLLVYFIELAYRTLLRDGGQFAFIINNKWIRSGYGEGLRNMLQQHTHIHQLLDFGDLPVFESAMAYPCILMFEKKTPAPTFDVVLFEEVPFRNGKKLLEEVERLKFSVKTSALKPDQWQLNPPIEEKILNTVKEQSVSLDEYISGGAYYGIKTGASAIFMLPQEEYEHIPPQERNILKPMLMGRDLKKYSTQKAERWLIFTRRGIDMGQYPRLLAYLENYREQLEPKPKNWTGGNWLGRKEGTYKWYEIQDAVDYWELFEQPKIMYQKFQVSPCFVLDYNGLYCNDSMWIIPTEDKYLLGYLNSQLGWWCITMHCSRIQNGYQLMYDYFKNVPIPKTSARIRQLVADFVAMIMLIKQQEWSARHQLMSDYFERLIDVLIFETCFESAMKERQVDIAAKIEYAVVPEQMADINELFNVLYEPTHPVQSALFNLRLVPEITYIQKAIRKNTSQI